MICFFGSSLAGICNGIYYSAAFDPIHSQSLNSFCFPGDDWMNTFIRTLVILVVSIFNVSIVLAAAEKSIVLDQEKIHAWYYAGKVDSAVRAMERFQQKNKTFSRSDSLFLCKYLGVIYSMNPFDREKGGTLFAELLAVDSAASIEDMFAPPEVDSIFNALKPKVVPAPSHIAASTAPPEPSSGSSDSLHPATDTRKQPAAIGNNSHRKQMFWIASGVAAATAVGVATYYIVSAEPKSQLPTTAVWDGTNPR
jgi:hypothetical protein